MEGRLNDPLLLTPSSVLQEFLDEQFEEPPEEPLSEVAWTSDEEDLSWAPRKRKRTQSYPLTQVILDKTAMNILQALDDQDRTLKSANLFNQFLKQIRVRTFPQSILERLLQMSTVLVQVTITYIIFNTFNIYLCNVLLVICVVCYRGASKLPVNGGQGL